MSEGKEFVKLTAEERQEIRARYEATTPGEWRKNSGEALKVLAPHGGYIAIMGNLIGAHGSGGREKPETVSGNAEFIAHSHADVPRLLDSLDAEEAENARLRAYIEEIEATKIEELNISMGQLWDKKIKEIFALHELTDENARLRELVESIKKLHELEEEHESAGIAERYGLTPEDGRSTEVVWGERESIKDRIAELEAGGDFAGGASLQAENARLLGLIGTVHSIAHEAPELNLVNYDEGQVEELNTSMVQICTLLEAAVPQPQGCNDKEEQIITFFLEAHEPAPPCQRVGGKCLISESTGLECASNEGPRNLDYLPCWKAFFNAQGGAQ